MRLLSVKRVLIQKQFDILKQEKGHGDNMSKIEKALAELDALMEEVNTSVRKKPIKWKKKMGSEYMDDTEENMMDEKMMDEKMEREGYVFDKEEKAYVSTLDGAGVEIGEPADRIIIEGGRPKASNLPVVKAFDNTELETLDLSVGNIEKAYEAFRQEQLEKLAYDNLRRNLKQDSTLKLQAEGAIAKANYDAQTEIASLKEEFTALRKF